MRTVDLKEKELKEVKTIIDKYRKIEDSLLAIEKQLEALDREREVLLNKLDLTRKEEVKFFDKIKKKHGDGKLDIYTMKYVITDDTINETNNNLELDKKS